jgi:outer membrane protein assembly factor BamB
MPKSARIRRARSSNVPLCKIPEVAYLKRLRIGLLAATVVGQATATCAGGGRRPDARATDPPSAQADGQADQDPDLVRTPGFSKCIEDWPTAGGPHPLKPSLKVDAPRLLWRSEDLAGNQSSSLTDGGPVLAGGRLAFQAGNWVYFINKDGTGIERVKYNALAAFPSALVADLDGNVYYSAPDGLFSLDGNGRLRWSVDQDSSNASEFDAGIPPVLGPDGVVYLATRDQRVSAYRTSDGKMLWSQPAPTDRNYSVRLRGGGGKAVFVAYESIYPYAHTAALDVQDGKSLGAFVRPENGASFTWRWGEWVEGWNLGVALGYTYVFDTCGEKRWSTDFHTSGVIAQGELLAVTTDGKTGSLFLSDMQGNIVVGPSPAEGVPIAAGADGTIYTLRSQVGSTGISRILAYSQDLNELWRLDLVGQVGDGMTGNVVLDDDGVMFFTRLTQDGVGTEMIAIQTASPGLADSSWPSLRHDNRGTAWLVPGSTTSAELDGGPPSLEGSRPGDRPAYDGPL